MQNKNSSPTNIQGFVDWKVWIESCISQEGGKAFSPGCYPDGMYCHNPMINLSQGQKYCSLCRQKSLVKRRDGGGYRCSHCGRVTRHAFSFRVFVPILLLGLVVVAYFVWFYEGESNQDVDMGVSIEDRDIVNGDMVMSLNDEDEVVEETEDVLEEEEIPIEEEIEEVIEEEELPGEDTEEVLEEEETPVEEEPVIVEEEEEEEEEELELVFGIIQAAVLNVRQGPGVNYDNPRRVEENDVVVIEDQRDGWYYVYFHNDDDAFYGWVSRNFVDSYTYRGPRDEPGIPGDGEIPMDLEEFMARVEMYLEVYPDL